MVDRSPHFLSLHRSCKSFFSVFIYYPTRCCQRRSLSSCLLPVLLAFQSFRQDKFLPNHSHSWTRDKWSHIPSTYVRTRTIQTAAQFPGHGPKEEMMEGQHRNLYPRGKRHVPSLLKVVFKAACLMAPTSRVTLRNQITPSNQTTLKSQITPRSRTAPASLIPLDNHLNRTLTPCSLQSTSGELHTT